jgi:hypothetical protein
MFTPTNSDQASANLSPEDIGVMIDWFRGMFIFYGSVALIALVLASVLRDTGKQEQATAGAQVGIHSIPAALHP